ncbi:transposon-transfer assisting family protein [Blautia liquoris]|uniref:Transposon-transfer assisting family protein n=1 Tax=Blautia liquoris TaxID=2779518 RepID=A0A7M2RG71_9FIRM|nr:transposon-transfer assisting family protein [Blautia liquoris]QOV18557.1 transposon-transfer assisting family protein [Blautia liquoris]
MSKFNVEETNLMCIYNTGSRSGLLSELTQMQTHLEPDERELLELTQSVVDKLNTMSDDEFDSITGELIADFEEQED